MKKSIYQPYFKDKKITVLTDNYFDECVEDIKFLAFQGAEITVTSPHEEKILKKSLRQLKRFKNISYTLGKHSVNDFKSRDIIIHNIGFFQNNAYIQRAKEEGTPVFTQLSLLLKILRDTHINFLHVGVAGTKGKSTTLDITSSILSCCEKSFHRNETGKNLSLLKKINTGDILLTEIHSWQLESLHEISYSPCIAVFTNFFEDYLNHYKGSMKKYFNDISALFKYQKVNEHIVLSHDSHRAIKKYSKLIPESIKIIARFNHLPKTWCYNIFGKHNEKNIAQAFNIGKILNIPKEVIKQGIQEFKGSKGRFENLGTSSSGVTFFNDNYSSTPESTVTALVSLKRYYPKSNIILLAGGLDKGSHYQKLAKYIARNVYFTLLFSGQATDKLREFFPMRFDKFMETISMKTAFNIAITQATEGDIVILSPGASAQGVFLNENDRNNQFIKNTKEYIKK